MLARELNARVEFNYPAGKRWSLAVVDLSVAGVSFVLDRGCPQMECGSRLSDVTMRIGEIEIAGDLAVLHITRDADSGTVCGALFHPATHEQQGALRAVLDTLRTD